MVCILLTIKPHLLSVILAAGKLRAHLVCPALGTGGHCEAEGLVEDGQALASPKLFISWLPGVKLDIWQVQHWAQAKLQAQSLRSFKELEKKYFSLLRLPRFQKQGLFLRIIKINVVRSIQERLSTKNYSLFTLLPATVFVPHSYKRISRDSSSAGKSMTLCPGKAKCLIIILTYKLLKPQMMQLKRYAEKMLQPRGANISDHFCSFMLFIQFRYQIPIEKWSLLKANSNSTWQCIASDGKKLK